MNGGRPGTLLGLTLGGAFVIGVAVTSCVGGVWLARRATARAREAVESTAGGTFDPRSVVLAELLLASLREDGAGTLARLPQAAPEEQRADPLAVHEKVVVVEGTVRDLRFERGLFTGRMRMSSGEDAYFVTPIAVEGMAVDRRCAFRGVPVAIRSSAPVREPRAILVGAFLRL